MKKNKKIYVDIEEISNSKRTFYKVSFIEEYDITLFGKNIKHKTNTKTVPFFFKSIEIAKDFCELKPDWKEIRIYNDDYSDREVGYNTYKILKNGNFLSYIMWDPSNNIRKIEGHNIDFECKEPVVDSFVTSIILKDWWDTNEISSVSYSAQFEFLSHVSGAYMKGNKHWKFELVENEN